MLGSTHSNWLLFHLNVLIPGVNPKQSYMYGKKIKIKQSHQTLERSEPGFTYSFFRLSAGFISAALMACQLTVSSATTTAARPASK